MALLAILGGRSVQEESILGMVEGNTKLKVNNVNKRSFKAKDLENL